MDYKVRIQQHCGKNCRQVAVFRISGAMSIVGLARLQLVHVIYPGWFLLP
jgi:hypothetical protein